MAQNKMLIDASHPEETRVVVVRGNRVEEFDFEAQAKKQLRGNIYLAKVTRVEPSLQAAFIDYGGNRHGFLAFSEIHPDYYQIPAADRQALLAEEAEAEEQEAAKEEAEAESAMAAESAEEASDSDSSEDDGAGEEGFDDYGADEDNSDDATGDGEDSGADAQDDDEDGDDGKVMAAAVETDSVSEPAPEDESPEGEPEGDDGEAPAEKPKRKRAPRKKPAAKKKAKAETDDEADAETDAEAGGEQAGEPVAAGESAGEPEDAGSSEGSEDGDDDKPARRSRRGSSRRGGKQAAGRGRKRSARAEGEDEAENSGDGAQDEEGAVSRRRDGGEETRPEKIESVGQEDALEEVPVRHKLRRQYKIQEVIRRRQIMLVQVVKEERGTKGAALTTYLSLAGRYSVLMPNTARGGGISRKITNAADRKRLKEIASELDVPAGMGVILRTAGANRTTPEVKRDFEYLMRLWDNVRNLTLASTAPCLVYEEGSLIKRSIRDLYDKDIGEVLVAGEEGYREAKDFMRMLMPSHAKNVKPYNGEQPLFSKFGVETQLDKMLAPQVALKSGGYLVINQTEALVSIDVNSGRSTREHSIEATALQTNLEAADEVARQLRLRDLAGLIVIDFIDMEEKRNNRAVERRLKDALKHDRARIQVGHISHFGLMEMSRQRIRASVLESTMEVCPHCGGTGHVRSSSSLGIHILRAIEDHLNRHPRFDVHVRLSPAAAIYLLNNKRDAISDMESRHGAHVTFEADPSILGQAFHVEKGQPATGTPKASRAIGMMDAPEREEEEADTGLEAPEEAMDEMDGAEAASEEDGSGQDQRNGRKRRRRRRGRGRGRERDGQEERGSGEESYAAGEEDEDSEEEAAATPEAGGEETPEPEDRARGRGRRSRRGAGTAADERPRREPVTAETRAEPEAAQEAEAEDAASRRPRRQTGRPGKRAAAEAEARAGTAAEPSPAGEETRNGHASEPSGEPSGERSGAPARPSRQQRNTRRVKAGPEQSMEGTRMAETAAGGDPAAGEANAEGEETGEKKSGFWGSGFFG